MKRTLFTLIIFTLIFVIFLSSQVSAILECIGTFPISPGDIYAKSWKDDAGTYHLAVLPIDGSLLTLLSGMNVGYNRGNCEITGDFSIIETDKKTNKRVVYIGGQSVEDIISALRASKEQLSASTYQQAKQLADALNTHSLILIEDSSKKMTGMLGHPSTPGFVGGLTLSKEGIVMGGRLDISPQDTPVYLGEVISKYASNNVYTSFTQSEVQLSGVAVKFQNKVQRQIIWIDQNGYFAKYDDKGNQKTLIIGLNKPTTVLEYAVEQSKGRLKHKNGLWYMRINGIDKEITTGEIEIALADTTRLCPEGTDSCFPIGSGTGGIIPISVLAQHGEGSAKIGDYASVIYGKEGNSFKSGDVSVEHPLTKEAIEKSIAIPS